MALTIKELKAAVEKLSPDAFGKFANWVYNLAERRDYEPYEENRTRFREMKESVRRKLRAFGLRFKSHEVTYTG
jgi:hypothetical protein